MALESTETVFHFSTAHVPVKERLSSWNNFFGRSLSRRVLVPPPRAERDFHIEMTARMLEGDGPHPHAGSVLDMSVTSGGTAHRTPALLSDGNDDVVLHMQNAGSRTVLFELDGTTLSTFKLGLRLSRVRRMLVGASHASLTISKIAYRAGFNDLSTFNREFRRHFGTTPSEFRAWARP